VEESFDVAKLPPVSEVTSTAKPRPGRLPVREGLE